MRSRLRALVSAPALVVLLATIARGDEPTVAERTFAVANGGLKLVAPPSWTKKKPSNNIVEHEFAVPKVAEDAADGRVTVMGAQGGVEANVQRWLGQFSQPDGSASKDRLRREQKQIAGQEVHLVDISGTYSDQRGPFAGGQAVQREHYRMLGAIVVTKRLGSYFVKFYGPEKTVAANERAFRELIESPTVQ